MIDVDRINFLAKKKRECGLTEGEQLEQTKLRREYIDSIKNNLEAQLANTFIVDENGQKRPLPKKEIN